MLHWCSRLRRPARRGQLRKRRRPLARLGFLLRRRNPSFFGPLFLRGVPVRESQTAAQRSLDSVRGRETGTARQNETEKLDQRAVQLLAHPHSRWKRVATLSFSQLLQWAMGHTYDRRHTVVNRSFVSGSQINGLHLCTNKWYIHTVTLSVYGVLTVYYTVYSITQSHVLRSSINTIHIFDYVYA